MHVQNHIDRQKPLYFLCHALVLHAEIPLGGYGRDGAGGGCGACGGGGTLAPE